ncbi:hypothetical protein [Novosphingobium kaempferiae]|uniref:hypothetical protein n=1 Tax=Novosphingobium kaempferiae TaxID=2896849 RepID=UPI001E362D02|nr:hypothetical protein [Novosphingobium kaempferiae]
MIAAMHRLILLVAATALSHPAHAQSVLETGFNGALKGCEEWVLNPASWESGSEPFVSSTGLGNQIGAVDRVEEINLPPTALRAGNHYWRINSTTDAGYVLVTSDRLPMCHVTGGGAADLQPPVEAVLSAPEFGKRWEKLGSTVRGDMVSTQFRSRVDPAFSMVISRAKAPGQSTDRVQVIATATYALSR